MPCSFAGSPGHIHLAFQVPVHTHFSQMGRKISIIWEITLGHLLCLPYRASATWMHTHAHAYTCIHTHTHIHPHVHTHIPRNIYTHTYAHTHIPHIYTHTCMHTHMNTCTRMCMPPHAHIPTYTDTGGHAQSGLRRWEPLVSQCSKLLPFLLGFLSRSQMSM